MRFNSTTHKHPKAKKFSFWATCFIFLLLGFFLGWKNFPGFIKANLILLSNNRIWDVITEENTLDTIHLAISFKNFQKIENKRKIAIQNNRLEASKEDFVKAKISQNNKQFDCNIRLKGDLPDHWSGDKFSLRVEMKGGNLINGMSKFSLQDPATRMDTAEWLFLNSLRKEGLMAVRYDFVNLVINGKAMGIYALEEHFSKEMIEANNRREGVIAKFSDDLFWKIYPPYNLTNIDWNSMFRSSAVDIRNSNKNSTLMDQSTTAHNLLKMMQRSEIKASKLLDFDKTAKFLALTKLWSAEHGLDFDDINFYFNPINCLLEPIGYDANPNGIKSDYCYFSWGYYKDN